MQPRAESRRDIDAVPPRPVQVDASGPPRHDGLRRMAVPPNIEAFRAEKKVAAKNNTQVEPNFVF